MASGCASTNADPVWQEEIPDSLLFHIFSFLDDANLTKAARVCHFWKRIAYDDLLWQKLIKQRWSIKGRQHPSETSWRYEYKRLDYHAPVVESEVLREHKDEVLDASFSNNGKYFLTVCKDSTISLWKSGYPTSLVETKDTKTLANLDQCLYSQFNSTDTLVLVCGVTMSDDDDVFLAGYPFGKGIVFSVPDLKVHYVVSMNPPTLFGSWLTDDSFVGGNMVFEGNDFGQNDCVSIQLHKVPTDKTLWVNMDGQIIEESCGTVRNLFTFPAKLQHLMNLLVSHTPVPVFARNEENLPKYSLSRGNDREEMDNGSMGHCQTHETSPKCKHKQLFDILENEGWHSCLSNETYDVDNCETISSSGLVQGNVQKRSCKDVWTGSDGGSNDLPKLKPVCRTSENLGSGDDLYINTTTFKSSFEVCTKDNIAGNNRDSCESFEVKELLIFVTGNHDTIGVHEVKDCDIHEQSCHGIVLTEEQNKDETFVQNVEQAGDGPDPMNVSANGLKFNKIDRLFYLGKCYITGLCLSEDHRFLFYNFRELQKPSEGAERRMAVDPFDVDYDDEVEVELSECEFSEKIQTGVIDLQKMVIVDGERYCGHVGLSQYPAWYICLDASRNFLGSGSEDAAAYLWDRHYQCHLAKLPHTNGVVNGISFCPTNQECLITACDDQSVRIWRSKNEMKKLSTLKKNCVTSI